nr:UDP-glucuronosyltransferase [Nilaparvata lugens]
MKRAFSMLKWLVVALVVGEVDAARILSVCTLSAKSHHYIVQPVLKELVHRGHELTFITTIPMNMKAPNFREIVVKTDFEEKMKEMISFENIKSMSGTQYFNMIMFWPMGWMVSEDTLKHAEVQKLLNSESEKFDLIILETHFGQESLLGFGHRFNAPVVSIATFTTFVFIDEFVGNPFGVAYLPSFDTNYNSKMTFVQRLHNFVRAVSSLAWGYAFYLPKQDGIMRKYFTHKGAENMPYIADMIKNISLVIINSQESVDYARPLVPNVVQVGGLHIANTTKPLPQDLKKFLDESKHGVIYFSFGTVVPSHQLPVEMRDAFVKSFAKIKQNVLWKIDVTSIPGLPPNVKLAKWLPQQDVLAHPNIKAFITHGGLLSQMEAVYNALPLIGVPFFGDQFVNVERAKQSGFALPIYSDNITEQSVSWAIKQVLENPSYKEAAKRHSAIFRDNPIKQTDKAAYWIEYVLRHNGAPHLRSEGRNLPYYQYLLLDVIAFIVTVLLTIIAIIYTFLKMICSLCCGTKKDKQQKSKQEKKKKQQ